VVLYVDADNQRVFVIELRKINRLIDQEEKATDISVPFDLVSID